MTTRRAFLYGTGALFGISILPTEGFTARFSAGGPRVRCNVATAAGQADLAIFADAISIMKSKSRSDPLSWWRQADIHGNGTLHMHQCWRFFPWHRLQGALMEAIVINLTGKPDFAMPYWDPVDNRRLPRAFFEPATNSNPLYDPRRLATADTDFVQALNNSAGSRGWPRPTSLRNDFRVFMGGPGRDRDESGGPENNTHGAIHTLVGGDPNIGQLAGDMSQFSTATLDPIFWLHHANIDRVWASWQNWPGALRPEQCPTEFMGERLDQQLVLPQSVLPTVLARDLLSTAAMPFALGYTYDRDFDRPSFAPPSRVPDGWTAGPEKSAVSQSVQGASGDLAKPAVVRVPIPAELRPGINGNLLTHLAQCQAELVLKHEGLNKFNLRVFVDKSGEIELSTESPSFSDFIAPFMPSDADHHHMGTDEIVFLVDVTDQVRGAFERGAGDGVSVIVQPVPKYDGAPPGAKISLLSAKLTSTVRLASKA